MRPIGHLPTEDQAQTLVDYLYLHDIEAQVETNRGGEQIIWVIEESQVDEARGLLSRFRSMPNAEEFSEARRAAEARRKAEKKSEIEQNKRLPRPKTAVFRGNRGGFTLFLLLASILVALLTRFGENSAWTGWFLIAGGNPFVTALQGVKLPEVAQGQIWRLFTPIFLHFTWWHLLFNLLWLQDLGQVLEARIGTARYAGAILLMALVSNLAQFFLGGPYFGGMSGVVYGLFGYLWVRNRLDPRFGVMISPLAGGMLMVFLAMGMFGLVGPTANAAHFSGLMAGAALGWLAAHER
ncbi:MAG: rhomboid family intramembrane serine protease [Lentisphaerae bacterium]|jgi:GlpG protein|nr:rhomboid family intramembrane serine protease [Lentisphaerota bacterium]